jgi:DNA replication and repair protein RecF
VRLARLELNGFRCWGELDLALPEGRLAFVGANASGKTSIVEAAWYAATLASHRAPDAALVMRGRGDAVVRAHVDRSGRRQVVELQIRSQGASRVQLGGSPVRRKREILGVLRASMFAPERVAIVRGDPAERRRLLDEVLVQLTPRLYAVGREYDRALRQRNALLKESIGREPAGLDAWDAALAAAGAEMFYARADVVAALAPHASAAWDTVAAGEPLTIAYKPNVPDPAAGGAPPTAVAQWETAMRERLAERRGDEIARGVTLVGPHRDDLAIDVGGLPSRTHASQGEAWLIALALVLAAHATITERTGEQPVLLLDDALEPLDPERRARVGKALPHDAQVFVTAADARAVPDEIGAAFFDVVAGSVEAR